jgi:hypothetical protein
MYQYLVFVATEFQSGCGGQTMLLLRALWKHAHLGHEGQVGQSTAVGKSLCPKSAQSKRPSLAAVSSHLTLSPDSLTDYPPLSSLPHGRPRVGAHGVKRDQPVKLFRREKSRGGLRQKRPAMVKSSKASHLYVLDQPSAPQTRTSRLFDDAGGPPNILSGAETREGSR